MVPDPECRVASWAGMRAQMLAIMHAPMGTGPTGPYSVHCCSSSRLLHDKCRAVPGTAPSLRPGLLRVVSLGWSSVDVRLTGRREYREQWQQQWSRDGCTPPPSWWLPRGVGACVSLVMCGSVNLKLAAETNQKRSSRSDGRARRQPGRHRNMGNPWARCGRR